MRPPSPKREGPKEETSLVRSPAHLLNCKNVRIRLLNLPPDQAHRAVFGLNIDHAERIEQRYAGPFIHWQVEVRMRQPNCPDLPQFPFSIVDQGLRYREGLRVHVEHAFANRMRRIDRCAFDDIHFSRLPGDVDEAISLAT